MKSYKWLLVIMAGLVLSCNRNDVQPLPESLPIEYEFEPVDVIFNTLDINSEELKGMPDKSYIVYSDSDFPEEDLMGLQQIKESDIDFNEYTLLLNYQKVQGIIIGHSYSWSRIPTTLHYNFNMNFFIEPDSDEEFEKNIFTYYRSAVLVKKISMNSDVEFWYSVQ